MSPHENEPMSQKRRLTGGVWPAPPLSKSTTQKAHNTSLPFSPPVGLESHGMRIRWKTDPQAVPSDGASPKRRLVVKISTVRSLKMLSNNYNQERLPHCPLAGLQAPSSLA